MEKEITLEEFCEEVCSQIRDKTSTGRYLYNLFNIYGMHFSEYIHLYKGSDNSKLLLETMYQLFSHERSSVYNDI